MGISRGHRFGLLLTVPNILAGGLFVAQRGAFRYLGFVDNGNPPLYPGYQVDETPYLLKHSVSDKRQEALPGQKEFWENEIREGRFNNLK